MKSIEQYMKFDKAYNYYNAALFDKSLPGAFITLNTGGGFGYYGSERFKSIDKKGKLDEVALRFHTSESHFCYNLYHSVIISNA